MDERTKEIVDLIVGFLIDTTGNEIFDKLKSRRKISKVLKEDRKNIERIFYAIRNSDLYNLVEEFILFSAFKEVSFYSSMDLTVEQEEKIWEKFSDFIKAETGDSYVKEEYRNKIIRCINLHNKAINSVIMDEQNVFHMKMLQSLHRDIKDSLNHIINTLNTDTNLQDDDKELNFSVEQLEMIIKSYRFDINQLRMLQIISICGVMVILLFMSIFFPLSLKYAININSVIIMCSFLAVVVLILLMFWKYISLKSQRLEKRMEEMRILLWEIHYKLYENQIECKYSIKVNSKYSL